MVLYSETIWTLSILGRNERLSSLARTSVRAHSALDTTTHGTDPEEAAKLVNIFGHKGKST
jgi:hypothetical protein